MASDLVPSVLDEATLARLRTEAEAERSPFIDPAFFRRAPLELGGVDGDWLTLVTGRTVTSWTRLRNHELHLALAARRLDEAHLASLAAARWAAIGAASQARQEAVQAAHQKQRDDWDDLRSRLPVAVAVGHNWTSARHLAHYVQGAEHIVVLAALTAVRFRRDAGEALCETPSKHDDLAHLDRSDDGQDRLPTCKTCLRHARRLARPPSERTPRCPLALPAT